MQALRRLSSPLARVLRDGKVVEVGREGHEGKEGGGLGELRIASFYSLF